MKYYGIEIPDNSQIGVSTAINLSVLAFQVPEEVVIRELCMGLTHALSERSIKNLIKKDPIDFPSGTVVTFSAEGFLLSRDELRDIIAEAREQGRLEAQRYGLFN